MHGAIQRTDVSDLPTIALTLARAFEDDPVFLLLFGGSASTERTSRFFEIIGRMQHGHGHVYSTIGHEAAAIWAPPGEWKMPNSQIVKNAPALLRVFGWRFVANLGMLSLLEKNHPTELHYYLEFIGTDPAHRGKGLGSALMQPMIDQCDREGVGAYLESSKEANLAFYGRFGFKTTKIITHKAGPQQWLMWRDPK